jgi:ubiquinol-cytochrome c reductase cytochrome b subunit
VVVLFISGGNDTVAKTFDISLNAMIWGGRIALVTLPPIAYLIACRVCLGLQLHDRELIEHGIETGIITMLPTGKFIEVRQQAEPTDKHGHRILSYSGTPVPKRINQVGAATRLKHIRGFFYPVKEKPEIQAAIDELEEGEGADAVEGAESSEQLTE